MTKLKPTGNRVLVEPIEYKETSVNGIFIPDAHKERPTEGIVRAVGNAPDMPVKVGDHVLLSKYGGSEIKIEAKEYRIVPVDEILGVLS